MANDTMSVEMTGVDALNAKLEGLQYETKRKGGRSALRKAAQVLRDAARANAARVDDPLTEEDIAANIAERWDNRRFKRTGDLGFRVGVLGGAKNLAKYGEFQASGKKNPGGDTFYWRFLEFGTANHGAQPIIRPAIDQSGLAVETFISEYNKAVDRAIKRAAKTGTSA